MYGHDYLWLKCFKRTSMYASCVAQYTWKVLILWMDVGHEDSNALKINWSQENPPVLFSDEHWFEDTLIYKIKNYFTSELCVYVRIFPIPPSNRFYL